MSVWARLVTFDEGAWRFQGGVTVPGSSEARFNRLAERLPFSPVTWTDGLPNASGCLWAGVKGTKNIDLLRKFPAAPSLIVKKGASAIAVWSVWPEVNVPLAREFNERLARFFGGRVRDGEPHSFMLDLTVGDVFLLNNLHHANHVAGRL